MFDPDSNTSQNELTEDFSLPEAGGHKETSSILADQLRLSIWAQFGGGGGVAGFQPMSTVVHMEPK